MIGSAIGYDALVSGDPIGWVTIVATAVLAVIAEVFEFTLSTRYTRKYGGSRRAGWGLSLAALSGAIVGVPVPIIGSVIGAFVGSFAARSSRSTRVARQRPVRRHVSRPVR
jgi:uncharacterized protein YqgC (DUF456 family)